MGNPQSTNGSESEFEFIETPKAPTPTFEKFEECGVKTTSYPAIKNAPLPADAAGNTSFSNLLLAGLVFGVPTYMSWKVGGGMKTSIFFGLFTTVPILISFWYRYWSYWPRFSTFALIPSKIRTAVGKSLTLLVAFNAAVRTEGEGTRSYAKALFKFL